ncbi:hypothetical protein THAOC_18693, partial [Thalassiosira oceanica]
PQSGGRTLGLATQPARNDSNSASGEHHRRHYDGTDSTTSTFVTYGEALSPPPQFCSLYARIASTPRPPAVPWYAEGVLSSSPWRNVHFMVRGEDLWLVLNADDRSESTTPEARRSYEENTILYQWGTKTAVRRSNPDGFGVTLACVDWGDDGAPAVEVRNYDGVNWEKSHAETGIAEQTAAKRH